MSQDPGAAGSRHESPRRSAPPTPFKFDSSGAAFDGGSFRSNSAGTGSPVPSEKGGFSADARGGGDNSGKWSAGLLDPRAILELRSLSLRGFSDNENENRSTCSSPSQPTSPAGQKNRRLSALVQEASNAQYAGPPPKSIRLCEGEQVFNPDSPQIKSDILRMIIQYLANEGYYNSMMSIQDEANVSFHEQQNRRTQLKRMRKLIMEGDWPEVEKLCTKQNFRNYKAFLYAVYKQQYLEMIERQEYQKAFSYLTKRLKPLEGLQKHPQEFKDLCYLVTCKSVTDVASFKSWEGIQHSREQLVEHFQAMMENDTAIDATGPVRVPSNRLIELLQQAVAYQVEFSRYHPKVCPRINTLLEDWRCFVLPNALRSTMREHRGNVKCVEFVGDAGLSIVSGSSDNTCKIWRTETGECLQTLTGHTSRIWDVSSTRTGEMVASASGDSTIKIWDLRENSKQDCIGTLTGHEGDVYAVKFHPHQSHLASGGYDKTVRLWDARTGALTKTFTGHQSSVTGITFNPLGNLIISASKDTTIKFWDVVSGLCIKTYNIHLGEVTSVALNDAGTLLLSCSKDNSNRLWDVRMARVVMRFKGNQNTSVNFIRANFGPNQSLVIGGSEDSMIYVWDIETGQVLQKLRGHNGTAYGGVWNAEQSLLASCSHDHTVRTWWFDQSKPLFDEDRS